MNQQEIDRILSRACNYGTLPAPDLRALRDQIRADARALWAVRVLDAWAERNEDDALCAKKQNQMGNEYWECPDHEKLHTALTPDAARIAAATALVAADPSLGSEK